MPRPRKGFAERMSQLKFYVPDEAVKLYPSLGPTMQLKCLELLAAYSYAKPVTQTVEDADPEHSDESDEELLARVMQ